MRGHNRDGRAASGSLGRVRAVLLGTLLAILVALVAYLILHGSSGSGAGPLSACASEKAAPEVRQVLPSKLTPLREELDHLVPDRLARLYEEGTVRATAAWSDQEPDPPLVSPRARRPDAYEMRWWAPNGDDLVGDVFVFASVRKARRYLSLAASARCHRKASRTTGAITPGSVNLIWLNPDGVAQADVFFARGTRVFRLTDAPARQGAGHSLGPGTLTRALTTLGALGCVLPAAHCRREEGRAVPA